MIDLVTGTSVLLGVAAFVAFLILSFKFPAAAKEAIEKAVVLQEAVDSLKSEEDNKSLEAPLKDVLAALPDIINALAKARPAVVAFVASFLFTLLAMLGAWIGQGPGNA